MEENMKCEQVGLIGELMQGKELTKQLCDHLFSSSSPSSSSSSSSSNVTNEVLIIEKILSSYEKALTMLNWKANVEESKTSNGTMMDSHCSFDGSPRSEVLDPEVKHKNVFKKRKTMPKWTRQVRVCSGTAIEGSLDDGYSWRKYGQKDILGAKFPRGYYRCTHRNVQGCQATKQVQKSDKDPTMYEINYRGTHTCTQASHANKASPSTKVKVGLGENKHHILTHQKNQPQEEKTEQPQERVLSFGSELELKIEDLDYKEDTFPSFCFSSPSIGSENEDNNIFSENNFMESFSPPFISPATSELGLHTSDFDVTEIISTPTSVTNYEMIDLDIFLDNMDFDTVFPINTSELCS